MPVASVPLSVEYQTESFVQSRYSPDGAALRPVVRRRGFELP
jgi:hypothetical protein